MTNKPNLLIVDDEIGICTSLTIALENEYHVKSAINVMEAFEMIRCEKFDICLLDLHIGAYDGLDVLLKIKEMDADITVIIMTAYFSLDSTIEAMRRGAYTYVLKPLNLEGLKIIMKQTIEYKNLSEKVEYLTEQLQDKYSYNGIIGESAPMKKVFFLIEKLKDVDTNILITGESGTGKELVAKAIHFNGKRKNEHFVEINCAAIPEGLLEEEMFGHKKGSFTGATDDKKGKFEYANNGTIFLDEIGDMPHLLQSKLLRVLQEKEYSPIGSNEKRKVDVRVISATNKNLKELVGKDEFRSDLYFRLNVMEINLPSLRERKQDLKLLFRHFIHLYNEKFDKNIEGFSKEAEKRLMSYSYPGNVRELANILEHAIVISDEDVIGMEHLPDDIKKYGDNIMTAEGAFSENLIGLTMKEIEKKVITESLARNNGSRKLTAQMLGISEKGLRNKIAEYNIK